MRSLIFLSLWFLLSFPLKAEIVERILAEVNDEIILKSELDRRLAPLVEEYREIYDGEELLKVLEKEREEQLMQLIEDKLILQEARKREIIIREGMVEEKVERAREIFSSPDKFYEALREEGLTLEGLKRIYEEELLRERIIDQEVRAKVKVKGKEIRDYYNSHEEDFIHPEEVWVSHIFIEDEKEGEDILLRLREGENFSDLANGENLRMVTDEMKPELRKAVSALKAGEVSPLIEADIGYYILRLERREEAWVRALKEVKEEIRDIIFRRKAEERYRTFLEELKEKAHIVVKVDWNEG